MLELPPFDRAVRSCRPCEPGLEGESLHGRPSDVEGISGTLQEVAQMTRSGGATLHVVDAERKDER